MVGLGVPELVVIAGVLLVMLGVVLLVVRAATRAGRRPAGPVALPAVALPAEVQARIREMAAQGQQIQAIKLLREATDLGLLDAKNLVDAVAAGRPVPTPGGPARADLAYRARSLAAAGREDEAVRVVAAETGMSGPEATAFVRALAP